MDSFSDFKEYEIVDLNDSETEDIDDRLSKFDEVHLGPHISGSASIGIKLGEHIIGGGNGVMSVSHIFYISTVYVDEEYRGMGYGRKIVEELEKRARAFGAKLIRLDTFDFQGQNFYPLLGYEKVGHYRDEIDGFEESFFVKWLRD